MAAHCANENTTLVGLDITGRYKFVVMQIRLVRKYPPLPLLVVGFTNNRRYCFVAASMSGKLLSAFYECKM